MTLLPKMTLPPKGRLRLVQRARRMLDKGDDIESIIAFLRKSGADQIDSLKILREITGRDLRDCKGLLHSSPTWSDRHALDRQLQDMVEAMIKDKPEKRS